MPAHCWLPQQHRLSPSLRQALNKAAPALGGSITLHTQLRALLSEQQGSSWGFTEDFLRKANWFCTISPSKHTEKISTLYKEQQRYNLNMQQLQTIYTEKQAYTNRTRPFITLQFWGSFWRKSQQINKIRPKEVDVASESDLVWNATQHPHLSPAHTSITLPAAHSSSHSSWTPFLYRGRFLSMFWYCTTVNMVLITRNNLQRLISIIHGHHLIVGIQVVQ